MRRRTMECLEARGFSDEVVQALSMVISELCENAVKYGSYQDRERPCILAFMDLDANWVRIGVECPVRVDGNAHLERFIGVLDWLQTFENPVEAYFAKLSEVAQGDPLSRESGLGLPRIAYEGQCRLSYELRSDATLAVTALFDRSKSF